MKSRKNKFIDFFLGTLFILLAVFFFIYDLVMSSVDFPILTTVYFIIFMLYRFLKPLLR